MKLSLNTFSIGADMSLDELMELLTANRFDGVEFRCEDGQKHGVEPEMDKAARVRVKALLRDAGLEFALLSTDQSFDDPNERVRAKAVARGKQFIDLAADLECPGIRVFGNVFPPGAAKPQVIQYVGESVGELGRYAEGTGVDVLLEMHGDFYYWEYCLGAVKVADHPRVAINYNCDKRDVVKGSTAFTFSQVQDYVRHVHMHALEETSYPYRELFAILKALSYPGYLSLELGYHAGGEKKVISLYAALYREMMARV